MDSFDDSRLLNLFLDSLELSDSLNLYYLIDKDCLDNIFIENIETINEYKNSENKTSKKILLSKILLMIIDKKKEFIKEKNVIVRLNKIVEENTNFIQNNIKNIKIDEIYIEIINGLIQNNKFDNYEYLENILINQLEIQNIDITKIFNELTRVLNIDESCVKKYLISKPSDLLIENKINFSYFWVKYILKDYKYLYKIPIFYNICINIKKMIKKNELENINNNISKINNKIQERIEYILKIINDSERYYKKYFVNEKLKYNLKYYELLGCGDKIKLVSNLIKKEDGYYDDYLDDYERFKRIENNKTVLNFFRNNYKNIRDFKICYDLCLLNNIFKESSFEFILENKLNKYKIININNIIYNKKEFTFEKLYGIKEDKIYKNYLKIIKILNKFLSFMEKIKTITLNQYKYKDLKFILIFKNLDDDKESECSYSLVDNPNIKYKDKNIFKDESLSEFNQFIIKANNYPMNESNSSNKNSEESINRDFSTSLSSREDSFSINKKKYFYKRKKLGKFEIKEIKANNIIQLKNGEILKYFNNKLILNNISMQSTSINENLISIVESEENKKIIVYSEKSIFSIEIKNNRIIKTKLNTQIKEPFSLLLKLKNDNYLIFTGKGVFLDNLSSNINTEQEKNNELLINQKCSGGVLRNGKELITMINFDKNNKQNNKVQILYYNIILKKEITTINISKKYSINNDSLYLVNNSLLCMSVKVEENKFGLYVFDINNNINNDIYITYGFKINYFYSIDNLENNKLIFTIGEEYNKWKIKLFKIDNIFGKIDIEEIDEIYDSDKPMNKIIYMNKEVGKNISDVGQLLIASSE